jgi:hypothetical protein
MVTRDQETRHQNLVEDLGGEVGKNSKGRGSQAEMDDDSGGRGEAAYWEAMKGTSERQDGVHYPEEMVRKMMEDTLRVLGENIILKEKEERVDRAEMFRNRCGRCGDKTHQTDKCHRGVKCERCNREGHATGVCWKRVTRCPKCGGKGQQGEECTADRRTRAISLITR